MAALNFFSGKSSLSLSQGIRNYLYCCFPKDDKHETSQSKESVFNKDESGENLGYESELSRQTPEGGNDSLSKKSDSLKLMETTRCLDNGSKRASGEEASKVNMKKSLDTLLAAANTTTANNDDDDDNGGGCGGLEDVAGVRVSLRSSAHNDVDNGGKASDRGSRSSGVAGDRAADDDSVNSNSKQNLHDSCSKISYNNAKNSQQQQKSTSSKQQQSLSTSVASSSATTTTSLPVDEGGTDSACSSKQVDASLDSVRATKDIEVMEQQIVDSNCSLLTSVVENQKLSSENADTADNHLFDASDLTNPNNSSSNNNNNNNDNNNSLPTCGSLRITLSHDCRVNRLTLIIHEARDLPSRERGGAIQTQVRMLLLPIKKHRHKTKVVVAAESNPQFNETFDFKVPTDDLTSMGLRMRLYGCERLKKDRLIGETIVNFNRLNTNNVPFWTPLDPRSNLMHGDSMSSVSSNLTHSESDSSTHSLNHAGTLELMLGVAYNGVTGRMAVEVIKGSNFKNMAAKRPPDTYVKLALMAPNGQEISRSKTSIRRGQPNPLYKETFMFQVPQFQLPDVSLMVSVFVQKSLKRKEMIGWFTMGNTNSSEDDASHWTAMLESKGEQVCRWHVLLEP